jgi:hypothetical protein
MPKEQSAAGNLPATGASSRIQIEFSASAALSAVMN